MGRKIKIRVENVRLWHPPFTIEVELEDGEDLNEALDERFWTSGPIPGEAEVRAEAVDPRHLHRGPLMRYRDFHLGSRIRLNVGIDCSSFGAGLHLDFFPGAPILSGSFAVFYFILSFKTQ